MITKTPKHPGYGKYFLAMEAPGDAPLRKNMKVITVRPNRRARLDFTSNDLVVSDEPEPELPAIDDPVDSDEELPEIDDGDVGVDDFPDVDDVSSELPDIDPSQTQNDPDGLPSIDEPSGSSDLPGIDPVGSSDTDLPEIDDDEPDMDVDLPDIDDQELPDIDDTNEELPSVDTDAVGDLPDVDDDDGGLPDVDDPTQSTNVNVSPQSGDEDFASPNDNPQQTNVEINPNDTGDQPQEDYTSQSATDGGDDLPSVDGTDPTVNAGDATTDTGGEDDNTDYTQTDTSSDPNTQQQGTDANQTDANNQNRGPGLEFDSVRKYNLYKEYVKLRTAIDNYITKLESCISDDPRSNQVIKTSTMKFRELYDLITDYMMMKFEICSYIQNLLFYQRQVATVQLIFTMLQETNRMQDKDERKNESKRPRKTVQ